MINDVSAGILHQPLNYVQFSSHVTIPSIVWVGPNFDAFPATHFLSKQRVNVKVVVAVIVAIVVLKQTFKSNFYCLHCCVFTEMVVIVLSLEPKSYPQKWNQIYRLARGYVFSWVKLCTRLLFLFNFHTFKKLLFSSQQTTYVL